MHAEPNEEQHCSGGQRADFERAHRNAPLFPMRRLGRTHRPNFIRCHQQELDANKAAPDEQDQPHRPFRHSEHTGGTNEETAIVGLQPLRPAFPHDRNHQERTVDRDAPIKVKAFRTQLKAIKKWGRGTPHDLSKLSHPILIANGDNDRMVPSILSEDLHRRVKGSELIIYPDSGHGGIFQFHDKFAPVAVDFLDR
jgi:pimeloyl-ACP methyl ester carboxylesterase